MLGIIARGGRDAPASIAHLSAAALTRVVPLATVSWPSGGCRRREGPGRDFHHDVSPMRGSPISVPATEQDAYNELQGYTLSHGGLTFIHQHVVDAWMAQYADYRTKPIGLTFALVGLYLHVERQFSGRQVQNAHMALARHKQEWPSFVLPNDRGDMTASRIMEAPAGPDRDQAIDAWCASVWNVYLESRPTVVELVERNGLDRMGR